MSEMGRLEFARPRDAWGGEATSFTPLLAQDEMLAYLGDETGIGPLQLVEVEHATAGNRSLDILAETSDGRRVAIENQYSTADHDHLTRGLAYAVATKSAVLVVVAEDHRDEFVSVAEYLNDIALAGETTGILVWLVQVRAVRRVGDAVWSPEFVVRAEPNEWEAAVRREISPNLSSLDEFYQKSPGPDFAVHARAIIEHWIAKPGARASHDAQTTVALYHRSPAKPTGINVVQLSTLGRVAISRGYLIDYSGAFETEVDVAALDAKLEEHFPNMVATAKRYYVDVTEDIEHTSLFLDWLAGRLDAALGV